MNPDDIGENVHLQVSLRRGAAPGARLVSAAGVQCHTKVLEGRSKVDILTWPVIQVANLNDTFSFRPNYVDLVNSRFVGSGIALTRWPSYLGDIKRQGYQVPTVLQI